jgi:hypothetical protein
MNRGVLDTRCVHLDVAARDSLATRESWLGDGRSIVVILGYRCRFQEIVVGEGEAGRGCRAISFVTPPPPGHALRTLTDAHWR